MLIGVGRTTNRPQQTVHNNRSRLALYAVVAHACNLRNGTGQRRVHGERIGHIVHGQAVRDRKRDWVDEFRGTRRNHHTTHHGSRLGTREELHKPSTRAHHRGARVHTQRHIRRNLRRDKQQSGWFPVQSEEPLGASRITILLQSPNGLNRGEYSRCRKVGQEFGTESSEI